MRIKYTKHDAVTVCGITYRSVAAAAADLGVSASAIYRRIYRGESLDKPFRCVLARRRNPAIVRNAKNSKPVIVDGVLYPTTAEAANAIGVSVHSLQQRIHDGKPVRGHEVSRPSELDLVLAEIRQRDRQPYQFSR